MNSKDAYANVARWYTTLEAIYSLGYIAAAKNKAIDLIAAGQHVAIVGCGSAQELRRPLPAQVQVHLIDQSPRMLQLAPQTPQIHKHCVDLFQFTPVQAFDLIIAPFFCNVFLDHQLDRLFRTFGLWAKQHTRLCVIDFCHPSQLRFPHHLLQRLYWWIPMLGASLLTGEKAHPPYAYTAAALRAGWQLSVSKAIKLPMLGVGYEMLVFARQAKPDENNR